MRLAEHIHLGQAQAVTFQTTIPAAQTTYTRTMFATNIPTPGYWGWREGKPGPVVVVESPEAEREVRRRFPWTRPVFVRQYRGEEAL